MIESPKKPAFYEFADFRVDVEKRLLLRMGQQISLTPKVLETLLVFLEHRGEVLEKETLMRLLWADSFVEESNLTQNVAVLRKALGEDPKQHKFILTIPGRGYRFVADVTELFESGGGADSELDEAEYEAKTEQGILGNSSRDTLFKNKWLLAAILLLFFLLFGGLIFWIVKGFGQPYAGVSTTKVSQLTTWNGLDDFPALSLDGNSVAYCSDHNGTFEIYIKSLATGAKEIQVTNDGKQNFEPTWSPDGQQIAYYSKLRGGVWVIPATGGVPKQLSDFGSHPSWSPDGKQIVFQSNTLSDLGAFARNSIPPSTLWLVSPLGGEPRQLTQPGQPQGGHGSPVWSPDGKHIAFEANGFTWAAIWTISVSGDGPKRICPRSDSQAGFAFEGCYGPTYYPDGRSIFYHGANVNQIRIDPATNEAIGEPIPLAGIASPPSTIRRVSFSADGKKMALNIIRRRESISSVMLKRDSLEPIGSPVELISNATGRNNFPVFSPDGKRLAFSSCAPGGSGCDVWLANADGSDQVQLTTAESSEMQPGWFPNADRISFVSDRSGYKVVMGIDLNTKRESVLFDLKQTLDYVRLSPDGKHIIFNLMKDGVFNVWSASLDGGEPKQLTFDKEMMAFPTWSADGKQIAFQVKRGDDTNLMVMSSDGSNQTQLTFDKGQSWTYGWSPDNDKILYAGQRDGFWNIYSYSLSTKKQQALTDYKKLNSFVRYPSWSPKGDQIAYEYSETTGNIWLIDLK